jgi:exopolysaccharide biosynthesis protein
MALQEVIKANIIVAKDGTLSVGNRNHSSKDILLLSNVFI